MTAFDWQGFNFTGWDPVAFADRSLVDKGLEYIKSTGANYIAIDWAVDFNPDGSLAKDQIHAPPLTDIAYAVGSAKSSGLTVFLKPHTADKATLNNLNSHSYDSSKFSISKYLPDWKAYLLELADFATSNKVDGIVIGTEASMADMQARDLWSDLISGLRQKFTGYLTYNSLFSLFDSSSDVKEVVFWDLLDFISVSLYVPLSSSNSPTQSELDAGWFNNRSGDIPNVIAYLEGIARQYDKPIFFGETGYQSFTGALWDTNSQPDNAKQVNYEAQVQGMQSLLETWGRHKSDWFKGVSIWQVTPNLLSDAMLQSIWHTQEFSTYGKPAAQTITDWFTGKVVYSNTSYEGADGADKIIASFADDVLRGGAGSDSLFGGVGNDTLYGNGLNVPDATLIKVSVQGDLLDNIGPKISLYLDGEAVLLDREVRAIRSGASESIEIAIPYKEAISSLSLTYTNEEYRGEGQDRNLYIREIVVDSTYLKQLGTEYIPAFNLPVTNDTWTMHAGGRLNLDIAAVNEAKRQASFDQNILHGGSGNDVLIGGSGLDASVYSGKRSDFEIKRSGTGFVISDKAGSEGADTLENVERLHFSDAKIALDLDKNAGTVVKVLGAVFGPASVSNQKYVGIGLGLVDGGMNASDVISLALTARLGANYSNSDMVNLLYKNVVGVSPTQAALDSFVGMITSGQHTKASLALMAANVNLNAQNIDLVGLSETGVVFV